MKKAENKFERMEKLLAGYSPNTHAAMRVMVRLLFFCHGPPKALGLFGGINGTATPLMSLFGIAGLIELVTGTLIVIGFRAAITPFIASGQMAVAYLMAHLPMGFRPIQNGGEETASIASWLHGNLRRGNVERQ